MSLLRLITVLCTSPYRRKRPPTRKVAIVVPLSTSAQLSADEQTSLAHLRHFLGKYDKYLVVPRGLEIAIEGFRLQRFPRKFFGSTAAHNHLLYSPRFYRAFADYEFVFFHHLDSLALSDQLEEWCQRDLDFIGPPWLRTDETPWVTTPRVGNGGFALLRVESALRALSNRYELEPSRYWYDFVTRNSRIFRPFIPWLEKLQTVFPNSKTIRRVLAEWRAMEDPAPHNRNSDVFWSDKAVRYYSDFKVASFEEGLRFAFEAAPRVCFELNDRKLPFGCHAWPRYDRSFWEPYLLC